MHPDEKGKVRLVTLRTKDGTFKRPIAKLCLTIPCDDKIAGYVHQWLDVNKDDLGDPPEIEELRTDDE